ncbi:MAG TPA: cation diffusion facilitator family transporter [Acidimicrobiales bacterium]|nr:cation diffusion facilitator family transporter [Acidimicrobiales bacterium]
MSDTGGRRAIIAAFLANLGIAIAKFVGFLVTGAASLLAEAGHSLADTANQGLLLFGRRRSARGPDERHPFGYGRERFFWAFVVALVLFTGGASFALVEGVEKLRHPHEIESAQWAIAILIVAVVLESWSLRTAVLEARPAKGALSWWRFVRTSRSPELPVVLLEDSGALLGLFFALGGIGVAHLTGDARWDAVGSLAIGVLLSVIAVVLAIEMKSLLMGEPATEEQARAICAALLGTPQITDIIHLRTEHVGPDDLLVVAKVAVAPSLQMAEVARAIDEAEASVRRSVPSARLLYIEPDVLRPAGEAA